MIRKNIGAGQGVIAPGRANGGDLELLIVLARAGFRRRMAVAQYGKAPICLQ
jgi:hypothetical protein